ncbi:hypothetical protein [Glycomyces tritici]|uniref:Secreted protein n=1 Tax=Glycomyces tritici TaxID=2665176 RepID=A0ABT7YPT1_9ACTN|nr:hypothetical protein [Glycomyces tritici]MDN3240657.1 hypothetical protein [Glycomyces tritici]
MAPATTSVRAVAIASFAALSGRSPTTRPLSPCTATIRRRPRCACDTSHTGSSTSRYPSPEYDVSIVGTCCSSPPTRARTSRSTSAAIRAFASSRPTSGSSS